MEIAFVPSGARYGLLRRRAGAAAPLCLVFATTLETSLGADPYRRTARSLLEKGFVVASMDLPDHGADVRPGEPEGLRGWHARLKVQDNLVEAFTPRVSAVIDHLVESGVADASRIAAYGVSRGGFIACHLAAADPRVGRVALLSPVTELSALGEMSGLESDPLTRSLDLSELAPRIARTPLWLAIGNRDGRVGTDRAIAFTRSVVAASVSAGVRADVSLQVLPAEGHQVPESAWEEAAEWLLSGIRAS